mgnify:CR=1 FL=1
MGHSSIIHRLATSKVRAGASAAAFCTKVNNTPIIAYKEKKQFSTGIWTYSSVIVDSAAVK